MLAGLGGWITLILCIPDAIKGYKNAALALNEWLNPLSKTNQANKQAAAYQQTATENNKKADAAIKQYAASLGYTVNTMDIRQVLAYSPVYTVSDAGKVSVLAPAGQNVTAAFLRRGGCGIVPVEGLGKLYGTVYATADRAPYCREWSWTAPSSPTGAQWFWLSKAGRLQHKFSLTMTSTTTFSAVSDVLGSLGTGSIGSDFAPVNSDYTRPYLTVPATAWSGTWAAGETATIPVTQAAPAVWLKNVVPAGAAAYGNDAFTLRVVGGSA